jgi:hypothetical protein
VTSLAQSGSVRRHRWLWPIIVLLVGGALAIWGMQRESARMRAVESQIKQLCRNLAADVDLAGTLNPDNPTVDALAAAALRDVIDSPEKADIIHVKVTPGDMPGGGPVNAHATHTAMLLIGDEEILGMRIRCDDPDQPITVLGVWRP